MQFLRDLLAGKQGLAVTYWLWGVVGSVIVTALVYVAIIFSVQLVNQPVAHNALIYGISGFAIAWSVFVCVAVINASTYERTRGIWGWLATILAVLGILGALRSAAVTVGALPLSFRDIESSVQAENLGLPVIIEEGLSLVRMETNRQDHSITYHYGIDAPTFDPDAVDRVELKKSVLEGCEDFEDWLAGPVKKIIMVWSATDGASFQTEIVPADCGV